MSFAIVAANSIYTSFSLDVGNEATFRHFIAHTEADYPGFGVATVQFLPGYEKGKFNTYFAIRTLHDSFVLGFKGLLDWEWDVMRNKSGRGLACLIL